MRDAVLGAIDGCITTFAIIAGSIGAGFNESVIIVLAFANLVADGFSMGVSNYLGTKSQEERIDSARRQEEQHIDMIPDGEKLEVREIFIQKGFSGDVLDRIVEVITSDRRLWVNTMLAEELGLQIEGPKPLMAGASTFLMFVIAGAIPVLPFLAWDIGRHDAFVLSVFITGMAFLLIGLVKGFVRHRSRLRSGLETFLTGGIAALLAYAIGAWIAKLYPGALP